MFSTCINSFLIRGSLGLFLVFFVIVSDSKAKLELTTSELASRTSLPPNEEILLVFEGINEFQSVVVSQSVSGSDEMIARGVIKNKDKDRWEVTIGKFKPKEIVRIRIETTEPASDSQKRIFATALDNIKGEIEKILKELPDQVDYEIISKSIEASTSHLAVAELADVMIDGQTDGLRPEVDSLLINMLAPLANIREMRQEALRKANKRLKTVGAAPLPQGVIDDLLKDKRSKIWTGGATSDILKARVLKGELINLMTLPANTDSIVDDYLNAISKFLLDEMAIVSVLTVEIRELKSRKIFQFSTVIFPFKIDDIEEWLHVGIGLMAMGATDSRADDLAGVFDVGLSFMQVPKNHPYKNLFELERLRIHLGAKLFEVGGSGIDDNWYYFGLGYRFNKYVSLVLGRSVYERGCNIVGDWVIGCSADIGAAKYLIEKLAGAKGSTNGT